MQKKVKDCGAKLKKIIGYYKDEKDFDTFLQDYKQLAFSQEDLLEAGKVVVKDAFNGKDQIETAEIIAGLIDNDIMNWYQNNF